MNDPRDAKRRWGARSMMMASGFAALGYQIVWTEQCSLWLGHESAGVLAVLAAFFGGLSVGGLLLGARIDRSACPARWYAGFDEHRRSPGGDVRQIWRFPRASLRIGPHAIAARDRFIESGRGVCSSPRVEEMLAQVREPLLSVLRQSPDFRPAYDPLLAMAQALARADASAARTLLAELSRLQPARTEAPRMLARLDATNPEPVRH